MSCNRENWRVKYCGCEEREVTPMLKELLIKKNIEDESK